MLLLEGWLAGDSLVQLRGHPVPADRTRALTVQQIQLILAQGAPLRDRVLRTLLYETAARAEESRTWTRRTAARWWCARADPCQGTPLERPPVAK